MEGAGGQEVVEVRAITASPSIQCHKEARCAKVVR